MSIEGKRYLVIGGPVWANGHTWWVTPHELIQLYGVPRNQCLVTTERDEYRDTVGLDKSRLITLRPRADGNYNIGVNPMTVDMFEDRVRELSRQTGYRLELVLGEYTSTGVVSWSMVAVDGIHSAIVPGTVQPRMIECLEAAERRWRERAANRPFLPR